MASVFKPFFNYQATRNPIFHRYCCIATYVKRGNGNCPFPVCGAELKDIPSTGSGSAPISTSQNPSSVNPFSTSQSPWTTSSVSPFKTSQNPFSVKHFSTSSQSPWRRRYPLFRRPSTKLQYPSSDDEIPSSDDERRPLVFNDDDPLVIESDVSSSKGSTIRSIDINTHTEFPAVPRSSSKENFHVLVNLKSNVTDTDQENTDITSGAPIDLVTVLDVSGSMYGEKIRLVKEAMRFVIDNLGPSDRLSVISFSHEARRLFPLLLMNESGKQRAIQAVNSLVSDGGTNITAGLKIGTKVIEERGHKNPVSSIMLLSDGEDNRVKTINFNEISKVQIPVHTFGFGKDHDTIMLHSISESSKQGTYSCIKAVGYIQDAFAQRIGGLLSVAVQDLQLHIQSLDPNLCLGQLKAGSYSTDLTADNQTGSVNIGDMYADEERDFLVLVKIPVVSDGNANDPMKLFSVRCSYKDPFTKESVTTEAVDVKLQRPETVNKEDMVASIEVDRQKNRLQAAEAMNNSRAAAESGDLNSARSIIDDFREEMVQTMHDGDDFSGNLDLELQEVRSGMVDKEVYASKGRGLLHAGLSSHSRQQATFGSASGSSGGASYKTPAMNKMLNLSRASRTKHRPADNTDKQ